MNIKEVKRKLKKFDDVEFVGGASEVAIETASREIGLPFPPQFIEFLREFGSGSVSSEEFIGLGDPGHNDVVTVTKSLRTRRHGGDFSTAMIPICSDGYGNYDCIDTKMPSKDGEFQIVEWLHDGGHGQKCTLLADSYFEWLSKMLDEIHQLDIEGEE